MAIVGDHFGAVRNRVPLLEDRRVCWHNDCGRHAQQLRRMCDSLCMIAGGKSHHAHRLLPIGEPADLVVGTAKFERAGALHDFGLDQEASSELLVEEGRFQERSPDRVLCDPPRRVFDVISGGKTKSSVLISAAP